MCANVVSDCSRVTPTGLQAKGVLGPEGITEITALSETRGTLLDRSDPLYLLTLQAGPGRAQGARSGPA